MGLGTDGQDLKRFGHLMECAMYSFKSVLKLWKANGMQYYRHERGDCGRMACTKYFTETFRLPEGNKA